MSGGLLAKLIKFGTQVPVGPNIREAAEGAARKGVGLGEDLTPPPPESLSKELATGTEPSAKPMEGELVDDLPAPEPKPEVPPAEREFPPATDEEAAEVVGSVNRPRPDPDEQFTNTNYERWDTAEEMEAMWETTGRQIDEAHGGAGERMSWDEMRARAIAAGDKKDQLGWLLRAVDTGEVDINNLAGNLQIARDDAVEIGEYLYRQAKKIASNEANGLPTNSEDLFMFEKNLAKFRVIQEGIAKITRVGGQLLGSMNYVASNTGRVRMSQLDEFLDSVGGAATVKQKAQNIAELGARTGNDLGELSPTVTELFLRKSLEVVEAIRYNNMLSGMKTSLRNIVGNLMHNSYRFVADAAGAGIGSGRHALRRAAGKGANPDAILISDFNAGMQSMTYSMMESLKLSGRTWLDPTFEIGQLGKLETRNMISLRHNAAAQKIEQQFGIFGRGIIEIADTLLFKLGARNLLSGDIFFKNALWRFETHQFAAKQVRLEGLKGAEAQKRFEEILTSPRLPQNLYQEGMKAAAVGTHTQMPELGTFARNFLALRNTKGPLGFVMRWAVPFARILVNIMTWSAKQATIPLHTAMPTKGGKALRQGIKQGTKEGDQYLGRVGLYSTLFATVAYQTTQNNITGTGRYVDARTLRQWKQDGWQPMAIRRSQPDGTYKYYSFAQIQPFGTLIAWMADMTDVVAYYGKPDAGSEELIEGVANGLKVLAAGPLEAPFAKGLYEWMAMMFEGRGAGKAVKNVARQYAGPPNWLRDIEDVYDSDRSDTYSDSLMDEIANNIQSGIPEFASDMPPRLTVFGEPARPAQSPWSIVVTSTSYHDDVFMALAEGDVFVEEPRDPIIQVKTQKVDLYKQEHPDGERWAFHYYKEMLGKARLRHLEKMVRGKRFRKAVVGPAGSDTGKREATGSLLNEALYDAKREAHEKFAKRYPASDFNRAFKEKRVDQVDIPTEPLHAGQRERKKERAEGVHF